jgi:large subunit ribosomal protein L31
MKADIHPKYTPQAFTCSCGTVIELPSVMPGQGIEICSNCHPFYTGKQKMIDSAGRIERFTSRYSTVVGGVRKSRKVVKEAPAKAEKTSEKAEKSEKVAKTPKAAKAKAAETAETTEAV